MAGIIRDVDKEYVLQSFYLSHQKLLNFIAFCWLTKEITDYLKDTPSPCVDDDSCDVKPQRGCCLGKVKEKIFKEVWKYHQYQTKFSSWISDQQCNIDANNAWTDMLKLWRSQDYVTKAIYDSRVKFLMEEHNVSTKSLEKSEHRYRKLIDWKKWSSIHIATMQPLQEMYEYLKARSAGASTSVYMESNKCELIGYDIWLHADHSPKQLARSVHQLKYPGISVANIEPDLVSISYTICTRCFKPDKPSDNVTLLDVLVQHHNICLRIFPLLSKIKCAKKIGKSSDLKACTHDDTPLSDTHEHTKTTANVCEVKEEQVDEPDNATVEQCLFESNSKTELYGAEGDQSPENLCSERAMESLCPKTSGDSIEENLQSMPPTESSQLGEVDFMLDNNVNEVESGLHIISVRGAAHELWQEQSERRLRKRSTGRMSLKDNDHNDSSKKAKLGTVPELWKEQSINRLRKRTLKGMSRKNNNHNEFTKKAKRAATTTRKFHSDFIFYDSEDSADNEVSNERLFYKGNKGEKSRDENITRLVNGDEHQYVDVEGSTSPNPEFAQIRINDQTSSSEYLPTKVSLNSQGFIKLSPTMATSKPRLPVTNSSQTEPVTSSIKHLLPSLFQSSTTTSHTINNDNTYIVPIAGKEFAQKVKRIIENDDPEQEDAIMGPLKITLNRDLLGPKFTGGPFLLMSAELDPEILKSQSMQLQTDPSSPKQPPRSSGFTHKKRHVLIKPKPAIVSDTSVTSGQATGRHTIVLPSNKNFGNYKITNGKLLKGTTAVTKNKSPPLLRKNVVIHPSLSATCEPSRNRSLSNPVPSQVMSMNMKVHNAGKQYNSKVNKGINMTTHTSAHDSLRLSDAASQVISERRNKNNVCEGIFMARSSASDILRLSKAASQAVAERQVNSHVYDSINMTLPDASVSLRLAKAASQVIEERKCMSQVHEDINMPQCSNAYDSLPLSGLVSQVVAERQHKSHAHNDADITTHSDNSRLSSPARQVVRVKFLPAHSCGQVPPKFQTAGFVGPKFNGKTLEVPLQRARLFQGNARSPVVVRPMVKVVQNPIASASFNLVRTDKTGQSYLPCKLVPIQTRWSGGHRNVPAPTNVSITSSQPKGDSFGGRRGILHGSPTVNSCTTQTGTTFLKPQMSLSSSHLSAENKSRVQSHAFESKRNLSLGIHSDMNSVGAKKVILSGAPVQLIDGKKKLVAVNITPRINLPRPTTFMVNESKLVNSKTTESKAFAALGGANAGNVLPKSPVCTIAGITPSLISTKASHSVSSTAYIVNTSRTSYAAGGVCTNNSCSVVHNQKLPLFTIAGVSHPVIESTSSQPSLSTLLEVNPAGGVRNSRCYHSLIRNKNLLFKSPFLTVSSTSTTQLPLKQYPAMVTSLIKDHSLSSLQNRVSVPLNASLYSNTQMADEICSQDSFDSRCISPSDFLNNDYCAANVTIPNDDCEKNLYADSQYATENVSIETPIPKRNVALGLSSVIEQFIEKDHPEQCRNNSKGNLPPLSGKGIATPSLNREVNNILSSCLPERSLSKSEKKPILQNSFLHVDKKHNDDTDQIPIVTISDSESDFRSTIEKKREAQNTSSREAGMKRSSISLRPVARSGGSEIRVDCSQNRKFRNASDSKMSPVDEDDDELLSFLSSLPYRHIFEPFSYRSRNEIAAITGEQAVIPSCESKSTSHIVTCVDQASAEDNGSYATKYIPSLADDQNSSAIPVTSKINLIGAEHKEINTPVYSVASGFKCCYGDDDISCKDDLTLSFVHTDLNHSLSYFSNDINFEPALPRAKIKLSNFASKDHSGGGYSSEKNEGNGIDHHPDKFHTATDIVVPDASQQAGNGTCKPNKLGLPNDTACPVSPLSGRNNFLTTPDVVPSDASHIDDETCESNGLGLQSNVFCSVSPSFGLNNLGTAPDIVPLDTSHMDGETCEPDGMGVSRDAPCLISPLSGPDNFCPAFNISPPDANHTDVETCKPNRLGLSSNGSCLISSLPSPGNFCTALNIVPLDASHTDDETCESRGLGVQNNIACHISPLFSPDKFHTATDSVLCGSSQKGNETWAPIGSSVPDNDACPVSPLSSPNIDIVPPDTSCTDDETCQPNDLDVPINPVCPVSSESSLNKFHTATSIVPPHTNHTDEDICEPIDFDRPNNAACPVSPLSRGNSRPSTACLIKNLRKYKEPTRLPVMKLPTRQALVRRALHAQMKSKRRKRNTLSFASDTHLFTCSFYASFSNPKFDFVAPHPQIFKKYPKVVDRILNQRDNVNNRFSELSAPLVHHRSQTKSTCSSLSSEVKKYLSTPNQLPDFDEYLSSSTSKTVCRPTNSAEKLNFVQIVSEHGAKQAVMAITIVPDEDSMRVQKDSVINEVMEKVSMESKLKQKSPQLCLKKQIHEPECKRNQQFVPAGVHCDSSDSQNDFPRFSACNNITEQVIEDTLADLSFVQETNSVPSELTEPKEMPQVQFGGYRIFTRTSPRCMNLEQSHYMSETKVLDSKSKHFEQDDSAPRNNVKSNAIAQEKLNISDAYASGTMIVTKFSRVFKDLKKLHRLSNDWRNLMENRFCKTNLPDVTQNLNKLLFPRCQEFYQIKSNYLKMVDVQRPLKSDLWMNRPKKRLYKFKQKPHIKNDEKPWWEDEKFQDYDDESLALLVDSKINEVLSSRSKMLSERKLVLDESIPLGLPNDSQTLYHMRAEKNDKSSSVQSFEIILPAADVIPEKIQHEATLIGNIEDTLVPDAGLKNLDNLFDSRTLPVKRHSTDVVHQNRSKVPKINKRRGNKKCKQTSKTVTKGAKNVCGQIQNRHKLNKRKMTTLDCSLSNENSMRKLFKVDEICKKKSDMLKSGFGNFCTPFKSLFSTVLNISRVRAIILDSSRSSAFLLVPPTFAHLPTKVFHSTQGNDTRGLSSVTAKDAERPSPTNEVPNPVSTTEETKEDDVSQHSPTIFKAYVSLVRCDSAKPVVNQSMKTEIGKASVFAGMPAALVRTESGGVFCRPKGLSKCEIPCRPTIFER